MSLIRGSESFFTRASSLGVYMNFPIEFEKEMRRMLGPEYEDYLACFDRDRKMGLRVNTSKISVEEFTRISPWPLRRIPWTENGFYYDESAQPSRHPYYYAGLYYLQEPSAMTPASLLPITPGDRVLDLCAAPGGKSTELGVRLKGEGLLLSNDISNSRARGLLKNIEVFGISNCIVASESPDKLARSFPKYFDKILVDAPCSGEGMFRKERRMIRAWEEKGPAFYGNLQRSVMEEAIKMLKPGGEILYSTCTFSSYEDEGTIQDILTAHSELELVDPGGYEGFSRGEPSFIPNGDSSLSNTIRIWPQRVEGEGHFIALFRDIAPAGDVLSHPVSLKPTKLPDELTGFLEHVRTPFAKDRIVLRESRAFYMPEDPPDTRGLRLLRSGLYLGEIRKNRFEPSQALAMALKGNAFDYTLNLKTDDIRTIKYLKGETIEAKADETGLDKGIILVETDGYPLGWGKINNGSVKNKYLPGWRMVS